MENWINYLTMNPILGVIFGVVVLSLVFIVFKKLFKLAGIILLILVIYFAFTYRKSHTQDFIEKLKSESEEIKEKIEEKGKEKIDELKNEKKEEIKEKVEEKVKDKVSE